MEVLPCGAKARPWRVAYVSMSARLCSRRSAERASTGVVKPPVKRLRRSAGQLADGQAFRVRGQPLEAVVDPLAIQIPETGYGVDGAVGGHGASS